MYKKPAQPPTNTTINNKKPTKINERVVSSVSSATDKKNQTNSNDFKNKDEQLLTMVKQFLLLNGFTRSYETLKNQKPNIRAKAQISQHPNRSQIDKNHILQLFDRGTREEFFKQTAKMLTAGDETAKKLQFELNIYFCIYSIHPFLKKQNIIDKASSQAFKKYLDTKGADLSGTSEFLSYFALPFMQKPQQHGALAHLFTKDWLGKIRSKLIEFIATYLKSVSNYSNNNSNMKKLSSLQEMYHNTLNSSISSSRQQFKQNCNHLLELDSLKMQNHQLRSIIENYQQKFDQFTESSKMNLIQSNRKWFFFSRDIFLIAKKHLKQDKVKLIDKYTSFFGGNIDEHLEANQISLFQKNSYMNQDLSITPDLSKQKIMMKKPEQVSQNYQIDLMKIRNLFLQSNNKDKQIQICQVLKALRERFAKKDSNVQRRQIIIEYERGDICGINQQNYIIQKKLLFDGSERIKEFYLKLTEVITTDVYGLQYLTKSKKLIQNLVGIFSIQKEFSHCRKHVLGILQRVSFSKEPRMQMIHLGIIPMIFNIFRTEKNDLSSFTVQFLIALMMNLSLKKQSKPDYQKYKSELISIVIEQMNSDNNQIRNYVNGTIFLLLTSKQIKNQALKQKLDQVVKQLLETREDDMCSQQYSYILNRLQNNEEEQCQDTDSEEEQEAEGDQYQDDDCGSLSEESDDYIEGDQQIANGQELLLKNYALLGPQAVREQILTRSVLDQTSKRLNNMTTSINRSRRLDNIFVQKGVVNVLQPELDNLLNRKK